MFRRHVTKHHDFEKFILLYKSITISLNFLYVAFHFAVFLLHGVIRFFITSCKITFDRMKRNRQQIDRLVFLVAKVSVMAAKHNEWVASALTSLSSDSLILLTEDQQNCEALIEEFFSDSNDDTGSKDEQVHFLCTL